MPSPSKSILPRNAVNGAALAKEKLNPRSRESGSRTTPTSYALGDNYHSLDIRISRSIPITGHSRATLLLEAFNVYNAANLSGFAGDLTSPGTFGQPVSRATQVFGSGGPRSIQLGARFAF